MTTKRSPASADNDARREVTQRRIVERSESLANCLIRNWREDGSRPIDEMAQHRFDIALSDEERLIACLAMQMIRTFAAIERIWGKDGERSYGATIEVRSADRPIDTHSPPRGASPTEST